MLGAALAALCVACDIPASDSREQVIADRDVESAASPAPGEQRSQWRAVNEQASAISGNLVVRRTDPRAGEITLAFAHGVTLWARPARLPASDIGVRALLARTRRTLGTPEGVFPALYEVVEERVAMSAPQGGLCGGQRSRYLAIAEFMQEDGNWALRVVSFHVPPKEMRSRRIDPSALRDCFAFDFTERAPL